MWDYGNSCPMPMDRMKYQLELYKKLIEAGEVEGVIFCSNCIADIGLDTVEYTRKWIAENAEQEKQVNEKNRQNRMDV